MEIHQEYIKCDIRLKIKRELVQDVDYVIFATMAQN